MIVSNQMLEEFCQCLEMIEATPGKKDKFALLEALKSGPHNELAQEYLSIAMDWYRIYGLGEKALLKFENCLFDGYPPYSHTWDGFKSLVATLEKKGAGVNDEMKESISWTLQGFSPLVKKWLQRALLKSVTMGVSEKTVNKVWPKLINFFEVQLADSLKDLSTLNLPETEDEVSEKTKFFILEPKLDGVRAICRVNPEKKTVKFLSRGGQPLYNSDKAGIDAELLNTCMGEIVFDGELFCHDFNDTMKVVSKEEDADPELVKDLRFFVFDVLTGEEWDNQKCDRTYRERREAITFPIMSKNAATSKDLVQKTRCHVFTNLNQMKAINSEYLNLGLEGVMVKEPNGLYEFKRTTAWLKFKPVETEDFKIIGVTEGLKKKTKGKVASIILDLGDGKTCECGSGLTDEMRESFMKEPPIGQYCEIEFKMLTPDGLLREPILKRMRPDKK